MSQKAPPSPPRANFFPSSLPQAPTRASEASAPTTKTEDLNPSMPPIVLRALGDGFETVEATLDAAEGSSIPCRSALGGVPL